MRVRIKGRLLGAGLSPDGKMIRGQVYVGEGGEGTAEGYWCRVDSEPGKGLMGLAAGNGGSFGQMTDWEVDVTPAKFGGGLSLRVAAIGVPAKAPS